MVKPGYKQTEVGVIPEEWEVMPVTDATSSIFLGLTSKVDYVNSGGVPLVRATDISGGRLSFDAARTISLTQHRSLTKYRRSKRGDILVSKSGSLGVCALVDVDKDFSIYESIIVLQPNNRFDSLFLLSLLRSNATQNRMIGDRVGSTVSHLNLEVFRTLNVPVPPIPEQQAIATVLSDADELIESLEQLLSKKRHIKQGAMQELLTGKKRLPGFSGNWDVKKVGLLIQRLPKTTRPASSGKSEGKYPFFTNSTKPCDKYLDEYDFNTEAIIANTGGEAYFNYFRGPFAAMADCFSFETNIASAFLYYLLKTMEPKINEVAFTGSGIKHLDKKYFSDIEISIPALSEQTAIAEVLSDMDAEIASLETKLIKARQVKQGMMQELLTGRIRLV